MRKLSLILATFGFIGTAAAHDAGTVECTFVWDPAKKMITVKDGINTKGEKMTAEQKEVMAKILKKTTEMNTEDTATLGLSSLISGVLGMF